MLHTYRVHYSYQGKTYRSNRVKYVLARSVIDAAALVETAADAGDDPQVWQVVHLGRIDLVDWGAVECVREAGKPEGGEG